MFRSKAHHSHVVIDIAPAHRKSRLHRTMRQVLRLLVVAIVTVIGSILVQLVYPASITTPLLRSHGAHVGARSQQATAHKLRSRNQLSIRLKAEKQTYDVTYAAAGVEVDGDRTASMLLGYSLTDRLTPFSLFRRSKPETTTMRYDEGKLTALANKISQENIITPVNATVKQTSSSYAVDKPSTTGISYETDKVATALKAAQPGIIGTLTVPPTVTEPAVTTEEARQTIAQHNRQLHQETFLVVGDEKFPISRELLKSFITISYDAKRDLLTSVYDKAAIRSYVKKIARKVYVAPVAATVRVHDGERLATTSAKTGQMLNEGTAVKGIIAGLKESSAAITVQPEKISLNTVFARSYSKNNRGLMILLQDWQSDTGLSAGITVRELNGKQRSASLNGTKQFIMASMSKLYLEHYLYDGVARGKWTMNSKLGTTQSLGTCLEIMIVYSNNGCYNNIGDNRGWGNVAAFTSAQGFSSTNPSPGVYSTTAQDTAWYLQRLQTGNLLTSSHRSMLLSHMKRQIYRVGIASGSRGVVANKVGYWGGYRHDAGIVYHPKSTYVLSVYTYGGSPSQIADLARRISNYMDK